MTVFPCSIRLRNDVGTTIAVYPGGRVTFCSASSEHNRKYFGIVTTSVSEEPSNSCHVFVTLNPVHQEHAKIASKFGVNCAPTDDHTECSHFPAISDPLVNAIRKYYEAANNGNDIDEPLVANSPQPSNDSSVTASNSDSGIGFKDDSGHQSDRILVVDIQNQRLHIQAVGQPNPHYIDCYTEKSDSRNSTAVNSTTVINDNIFTLNYSYVNFLYYDIRYMRFSLFPLPTSVYVEVIKLIREKIFSPGIPDHCIPVQLPIGFCIKVATTDYPSCARQRKHL